MSERRDKYHKFLNSPWWKHLRTVKLNKKGRCFICLGDKGLQIHHTTYKNLYKARSSAALKETFVLCGNCHTTVHDIQKSGGLSYESTKQIIHHLKSENDKARRMYRNRNDEFDNLVKNL